DGDALDRHLGVLPAAAVVAIARQVALALDAAHTAASPVYHRDLKPANIMVRRQEDQATKTVTWVVKVIDFGLALRADARPTRSQSTHDKSATGTLDYAPPEQTGELSGVKVGPYSDVFAFGKTFIRVLFGVPIANERLWKTLPADVRGPLRELLETCIEYYPQDRPPTFGPVLTALAELDRTAPEPAPKPPEPEDMPFADVLEESAPVPPAPPPPPRETAAERIRRLKRQATEKNEQARARFGRYDYAGAVAMLAGFPPDEVPERDDALLKEATSRRDRLAALDRDIQALVDRNLVRDPRLIDLLHESLELNPDNAEWGELFDELMRWTRDRLAAEEAARLEAERKKREEEAARLKAEAEAKARDPLHPGLARSAGEKVELSLP
ncbi:MAG: protein kinase, partial [Gemmataceae bacterium]|nr:protein kinase [Gemmataceae bacterium]